MRRAVCVAPCASRRVRRAVCVQKGNRLLAKLEDLYVVTCPVRARRVRPDQPGAANLYKSDCGCHMNFPSWALSYTGERLGIEVARRPWDDGAFVTLDACKCDTSPSYCQLRTLDACQGLMIVGCVRRLK